MHPAPRDIPTRRQFLQQLSTGAAAIVGGVALGACAKAADAPASAALPGGRKLGVALVGLGSYATYQLAPALRETRNCRLAGVVSGSPEKAQRWARENNLPERSLYNYETMEHIAENPDIDIIYIVTPVGLHAEHVIRAAKTGKHVISEKPMAASVAECDAMIAACKAAGVKFSIGYRLHFQPMYRELMRLARAKDFGEFTQMNGEFGFFAPQKTWRQTKKLGGGGPLMDVGIYVIQAACMAAGDVPPIAVTAHELPKTRPKIFDEVEETILFTLEFPGGARCEGRSSYTESYNHFRAEAPKGWFEIEPAYSYNGLNARTSQGRLPRQTANQQAAQMDDFADCIVSGRDTEVPGEMGRRDIMITSAIYEAARTGQRVAL
jgi:glucose-fructose oxidoreductase